jgi:hypothetical protein
MESKLLFLVVITHLHEMYHIFVRVFLKQHFVLTCILPRADRLGLSAVLVQCSSNIMINPVMHCFY